MIAQEQAVETAARVAAEGNWAANLRALRDRQPEVARALAELPAPTVEWVYGRDGYLTARAFDGWWSGSSLPMRTAEAVLKRMELGAAVTCFLAPTHAAQLRVALDRGGPGKALIAVVPDVGELRLILGCDAFGAEIAAGRLWFACGADWAAGLARVLVEQDGLPVPGQFVRTPLIDPEAAQEMIASAQGVLSREMGRRAEAVPSILASRPVHLGRVCAVTPGAFRLWEDVGGELGELANEAGWATLDPDEVTSASPAAFARAVAGCGTVVVSNLGRADLCAALPPETRVVTWLTVPRVPRYDPRAVGDGLLLADERWRGKAVDVGWPAERVRVGAWPARRPAGAGKGLAVIADTVPLAQPEFDLSSHRVVWDTIARELAADPFAVGQDVGQYLGRWLRRAGIAEETVDLRVFVDRLIVPAYQQGLVRLLLGAGVRPSLYGRGWDGIDEFRAAACGIIADREDLRQAVEACGAVAHVWPIGWAHPIESVGRPVLRRTFRGTDAWLAEARRLGGDGAEAGGAAAATPALSVGVVMGLVRG